MNKLFGKRLLIVEEALKSHKNGHWFEYIKAIASDCRADGMIVDIAAHQEVSQSIQDELGAFPALSFSAWDGIYKSGNPVKRYLGVFKHNFQLFKEIRTLLNAKECYDYVFAPTVLIHHLIAWYGITRLLGGEKFSRLVLLFMNTPGQYDVQGRRFFPPSSKLLRTVIKWFERYQRTGIVTLAVNTERAAGHYFDFCGLNFTVFPQPVNLPTLIEKRRRARGTVTLASYGFARHEKGSDLLQEALIILLKQHPDLQFRVLIQWGDDFVGSQGQVITKSVFFQDSAVVEYIDKGLNTNEYTQYLSKTDGIILPYRRSSYYDRDSRVAIEAAIFGIPVVYTDDTWLQDAIQLCGAGVGFKDENIDDLSRAIYELIINIDFYQRLAKERQHIAREYFSASGFKRILDTA